MSSLEAGDVQLHFLFFLILLSSQKLELSDTVLVSAWRRNSCWRSASHVVHVFWADAAAIDDV